MNSTQREKLIQLVSQPIQWQCRLDRYTSLAIGGPADAFVRVDRRKELQPLLQFLAESGIPWRVIGRGTNLVVKDEGFAGVILLLGGEFKSISKQSSDIADSGIIQVGAGYSLTQLALSCMEWGFAGVEFACGIPGSLGGAVVLNAGAWGSDMSSIVKSVRVMTAEKEEEIDRRDIRFSYRRWDGFAEDLGKAVVTEVELALKIDDPAVIRQRCSILQDRRKKTQLCKYPNAGSFFKNPAGDSAGRLIDASGLKGVRVGGAMVSLHHANFLINKGGATADDVLNLMRIVQTKVKNDSGIELEPEVHFI